MSIIRSIQRNAKKKETFSLVNMAKVKKIEILIADEESKK